jgi:hypothetical protein
VGTVVCDAHLLVLLLFFLLLMVVVVVRGSASKAVEQVSGIHEKA